VYISQGSKKLTDFSLIKFIRRLFYPPFLWRDGGQFSVKVAAVKRNASKSLSVTKGKAFYFLFPGIFTDLTKAKRRAGPYTFTISQKPSVDLTPLGS